MSKSRHKQFPGNNHLRAPRNPTHRTMAQIISAQGPYRISQPYTPIPVHQGGEVSSKQPLTPPTWLHPT